MTSSGWLTRLREPRGGLHAPMRPILTHGRVILSAMSLRPGHHQPPDGRPDLRRIHRLSARRMKQARRRGDAGLARQWREVAVMALCALQSEDGVWPGRTCGDPHCSHSIFFEAPENGRAVVTAVAGPDPDRRRTFREARWRC